MRSFFAKLALTVLFTLATLSTVNADVVFNFSPAADGSTDLEIIGTGSVIQTGIGFSYLSNSPLSFPSTFTFTPNTPSPMLNGLTFDSPLFGTDQFLFIFGGAQQIPAGLPLSELNGTYSLSTPFVDFNPQQLPRQSQLTAEFSIGGSGDLGPITLNVAAAPVPEPSSGSILLLGSAILGMVRRKR